jgi:hypothetical protein
MTDIEHPEDKALFPPVDPVPRRACLHLSALRAGQAVRRYVEGQAVNAGIAGSTIPSQMPATGRRCSSSSSSASSSSGLALWMEVTYNPPVWLHFVLWLPLTIGLCLWLLRVLKALLIALQYRNNARQGEIDRG